MKNYRIKIQDSQSNDLISFDITCKNKKEATNHANKYLSSTRINDAKKFEIIKF